MILSRGISLACSARVFFFLFFWKFLVFCSQDVDRLPKLFVAPWVGTRKISANQSACKIAVSCMVQPTRPQWEAELSFFTMNMARKCQSKNQYAHLRPKQFHELVLPYIYKDFPNPDSHPNFSVTLTLTQRLFLTLIQITKSQHSD